MASQSTCSQCEKPAIGTYSDVPLCVDHHLKMQQAVYLQASLLAANANYLEREISAATGFLLPPNYMEIPRPPFVGDTLTLNHIDVSNSTIGAINTGTIQNLDAAITIFQGQGETELASAVEQFSQVLLESQELDGAARNEIGEQLAFLVAQAQAKPELRTHGIAKSVLAY